MKSYTDLEQSKVLAEFLPLESADMYYFTIILNYPYSQGKIKTIAKIMDNSFSSDYDTPCWSLAALLEVLPKYEIYNDGKEIQLDVNLEAFATEGDETLLDLVVNMIIHLHELKIK